MKPCHPAVQSSHQKVHSLLDRRYAERVAFRCQITYSGEEGARIVTGGGTLKNLSKTGCKILGTTTSSLGGSLTLHLHLEDGQAPSASLMPSSPASTKALFPSDSPACRRHTIGGPHFGLCKNRPDTWRQRRWLRRQQSSALNRTRTINPTADRRAAPRRSSPCSIPAWIPAGC